MLRGPTKVEFLIQGPAPSCQAVRRLTVKGHRGMNRLRITNRPGGKPLRQGVYRVVAQGQSPARVVGVRIRKDGRIVPVKTSLLPAGWCVARYSALPSTVVDDATSSSPSARPAAFAPTGSAAEETRITGGVHAARAELRSLQIGPAKVALGVVKATTSSGALLRWFAIGIVGFLALSFPAVLVVAAWRDLAKRGTGRFT